MISVALVMLVACESHHDAWDHTWLSEVKDRNNVQDPPAWLLLRKGGTAYLAGVLGRTSCDTPEHYLSYNTSGDEATQGCQVEPAGTWLQIVSISPIAQDKFVVGATVGSVGAATRYVGAGDLSPDIPAGTELSVMSLPPDEDDKNDQRSTDEPSDDYLMGVPVLRDRTGHLVGKLLDHTRVKLMRMWAGSGPENPAYAEVIVLNGALANRYGYIETEFLNAISDDSVDDYDGVAKDQ